MSASHDPLQEYVVGYPKLAAQIEILPELSMFRRFGALNAQNLLYMQAELAYLEKKLRERQQIDANDPSGKRSAYALNWFWLKGSENTDAGEQQALVLRIRQVLKEYTSILKYPKPSPWDLHHMQNYLQTSEMGSNALTGDDARIWGSVLDRDSQNPDLITLCPREKKDAFSAWAAESTIINLLRCGCARFMKPSRVHGVVGYQDGTIYRVTYWFTSILASLIPIASIAVLYRVQSMSARLGIIAGFNVLVSICLMALTGAKRAEVFAITAA
ncbi:hypothetical protein COCSADRAFT_93919 [Bipolaris sorokiniana ND90Pr]|uniref:DUF6594 domain-containing protein n=1 Tax=Cochliobolus sativus (strain ND90Pr / ATCC 201652) TaxID=665912 RepID=M2SK82_COCSN|nr:uncharacterized protein COCSADRAFT_93919 [Bipolaris sorokiniana ND90Pr]EMD62725.1 hypothetical protein COCSADRAFT_93919 [Bipolaris sorokiniana ND90Pr]